MNTMRAPIALLAIALSAPIFAADTSRYLVATRHQAPRAGQRFRDDAHAVRELENIDGFGADLTPDEAAALRKSAGVRFVTPVVEREALELHAAPEASKYLRSQTVPYGIDLIHARELWNLTKGKGTVNVAILDTGIDYRHVELSPNYAGGYNTFTKTDDPFDDNRHGTHVAGIIAARDNGVGVVGVAPEARLWSVKVLAASGKGEDENIIAGVDWVISKKKATGGQWLITLSLGATESSPLEEEAFAHAADEGILTIAAAGNTGADTLLFPAAYPSVLSVGAIDGNQKVADFSTGGPTLGVVAPGVNVLSTFPINSVRTGRLDFDADGYDGVPLTGSSLTDITAPWVYCGLGKVGDFPPDIAGKIAVVTRGEIYFADKARNAKLLGAAGLVILNNVISDVSVWTLYVPLCDTTGCVTNPDDLKYDWPLTVALAKADADALLKRTPGPMTLGAWLDDYAFLSGTSMATPHVTGTAALLWSLAPNATAQQVRDAITSTAHDIGAIGYDPRSGYGVIDALAAAKKLAPAKFGLPTPGVAPFPPHRSVGH